MIRILGQSHALIQDTLRHLQNKSHKRRGEKNGLHPYFFATILENETLPLPFSTVSPSPGRLPCDGFTLTL